MKRAIFSDIHSNMEAFEACISDAANRDVQEFLCLGDVIGYGPQPREALSLAMGMFRWTLLGNHEEAVLFLAEDFNPRAKQAVDWTRAQLRDPEKDLKENQKFSSFMEAMKKTDKLDGFDFVHGSPRQPTRDYMLPQDIKNPAKMKEVFSLFERVCFCGHSHFPGVYTESDNQFRHPLQLGHKWAFDEQKVVINVGSVGQPRDGDTRASYITYDDKTVEFHRVSYDNRATAQRIRNISGLPAYLADRLLSGT